MDFLLLILCFFTVIGIIGTVCYLLETGKWRYIVYPKDKIEMIYDVVNETYKIVRHYNIESAYDGTKRKRETIHWFQNDEDAIEKMAEISEGLRRAKQFNKILK